MNLARAKILVTGACGMLAQDLLPVLAKNGVALYPFDISGRQLDGFDVGKLDITSATDVDRVISQIRPHVVINCAAYTAVDKAEDEKEVAVKVNGEAVARLALAAKRQGALLVHFSTDYVFGAKMAEGQQKRPFREVDPPCPCGVYGMSKRAGEEAVVNASFDDYLIVRTSWLHGVNGPNFVETILRAGKERPELRVVNDQIGSPTWSGWLAEVVTKLITRDARGFYHATSRGDISWYDFAKEILRQAKVITPVHPQSTGELNRRAPRPAYSTLDVSKLERFLDEPCITWKEGVSKHLSLLGYK